MGAVIGLVIGYVLGTRAGDKGRVELEESWRTISTSQGFRDMLGGLFALVGELVHRGRVVLAERLPVREVAEADRRALGRAA